jgi:hypothetical protein
MPLFLKNVRRYRKNEAVSFGAAKLWIFGRGVLAPRFWTLNFIKNAAVDGPKRQYMP